MKIFTKPPLPFIGNKKNFIKEFLKMIKESEVINPYADDFVVVDLFGGSGLLSHIIKRHFPQARVIYNDFENYSERLKNIGETEELRKEIWEIIGEEREEKIPEDKAKKILNLLNSKKYLDKQTLRSWLCFAGQQVDFSKNKMYNRIMKAPLEVENNYLEGLDIVRRDYKELLKEIENNKNTLFLFDPPYLNTDNGNYKINDSWDLKDFLDICLYLEDRNFVFFTSGKSSILEFIDWLNENKIKKIDYKKKSRINPMGKAGKYEDIMIFNV